MTTEKGISSISFVRASSDDVDELVESRMEVMREVWDLSAEQDMTRFSDETRDYYERAIPAGTHAAFMAYDGRRSSAAQASATTASCPRSTTRPVARPMS